VLPPAQIPSGFIWKRPYAGSRPIKSPRFIAAYRRLRDQPLWKLLAAEHAPVVIALLQTHLFESDRSLPASIFHERIERDLEELRAQGLVLPQTAQAYVADWLRAGYLERRYPAGASEEEYELSVAAAEAIHFVAGLVEPRAAATESRLTVVIDQLARLAEETDTDPRSRVATLLAERERLDAQIAAVQQGRLDSLTDAQAIERTQEIIGLAQELAGDFRYVRDRFESLNRELRERLVNDDASNRGQTLQALFDGVDLISESDAGRTFSAFWKLLTDPEQSTILEESIEQVLSRPFAGQLQIQDRRFLRRLLRVLLDQGSSVHDVLQHFARSLKHFVQSREYLEQRRLNQLLKEAQRVALALKDRIHAAEPIGYTLQLSSSRVRSVAQWVLYDPSLHTVSGGMTEGDAAPIGLDVIADLVAQSEIDFLALKANVRTVLRERDQASIREVMQQFPATQGLGSVVGYIAIGSRHGVPAERSERVSWEGTDGTWRTARIPIIYFLRERINELS
jgi:hypothetical protein